MSSFSRSVSWLALALWVFLVSLVAACFPPPLTCEELAAQGQTAEHCAHDVTSADSAHATDTSHATDVSQATDTALATDTDTPDTTVVDVDDSGSDTGDAASETADDADTEVTELNACGGVGPIGPGQPGEPCGPCLDGEWACVVDDPSHSTTRCEGAGTLDVCGGCGLAHPLGDPCGDCGTYACGLEGDVVCVEPEGECPTITACSDLDCELASRECIESDGTQDARCGDCLATHVLVESACVPRLLAPADVTASTDRGSDVEVTWSDAANATGYRVYRCEAGCAGAGTWTALTTEPITATRFVDDTPEVPASPGAPGSITATTNLTDRVDVSWGAVVVPIAKRYAYRVTAVGAAGEGPPSASMEGAVADRPVTGYEIQIDDGSWSAVAGTTSTDGDAPAGTLSAGSASASLGTYPEFVRLSATGSGATPGTIRSYRARAVSAYGPGAASAVATGRRVTGTLAYQWERSPGASADTFTAIVGANAATFDDAGAPSDGSARWYRLVVSASGASTAIGDAVPGARQGPPGVPGGVVASSDLPDRIHVSWQAVSGALGYHVYRDDMKLTSGSGVTGTSYDDTSASLAPSSGWSAPTGVTASTNDPNAVAVAWSAPTRPLGPVAHYRVSAVSAAGEGASSAEVEGNRAALALVGFDIEVTPAVGNATWVSTGSTSTTWTDLTAPAGTITGGTIAVSQGEHLAHIALVSSGASVSPGASVSYRVRGVLQGGASFTPVSTSASGRRAVGALTFQWQRSAGTAASDFSNVLGATAGTYNDAAAPNDGSRRWYRLSLGATGTSAVTVAPLEGWRLAFLDVVAGGQHTCALAVDGHVWCWGDNTSGKLGVGDEAPHSGPVRVTRPVGVTGFMSLAGGGLHTCALTGSGDVWCWGDNSSGQLGLGTNQRSTVPQQVSALGVVAKIGAGGAHTTVALFSTEARTWGSNAKGELGDGSLIPRPSPVAVVDTGGINIVNVLEVAGGYQHSCARHTAYVSCWGIADAIGQEPPVDSTRSVVVSGLAPALELVVGGAHSCVRNAGGAVRCWGDNLAGQLGDGTLTDRHAPVLVPGLSATELAASLITTCARVGTTGVWCWGHNGVGELGNGGATGNATAPVQVVGLTAPTAIGSGPLSQHICAVDGFGVRCWGRNEKGQLGDGTTSLRTSPVPVQFP